MCCHVDGYDDKRFNRARLLERVCGGVVSGCVLSVGLLMIKLAGL
jgi:hypothetical protein